MDEAKIWTIPEWEDIIKETKLHCFFGHANYNGRFISGYSVKDTPLDELLKKNNPWVLNEKCQRALKGLKTAVKKEPIMMCQTSLRTSKYIRMHQNFPFGNLSERYTRDSIRES